MVLFELLLHEQRQAAPSPEGVQPPAISRLGGVVFSERVAPEKLRRLLGQLPCGLTVTVVAKSMKGIPE